MNIEVKAENKTSQSEQILKPPYQMCNLQIENVPLGKKVTFTIPAGMSGKMVLDAIKRANPPEARNGVVEPESTLLYDEGLDKVVDRDTKLSVVICFGTGFTSRIKHHEYLEKNNLVPTPRWILTVAAALFRNKNGFPEKQGDIGTCLDKGDLFSGQEVRTGSCSVCTLTQGLHGNDYNDGRGSCNLIVAGSPRYIY